MQLPVIDLESMSITASYMTVFYTIFSHYVTHSHYCLNFGMRISECGVKEVESGIHQSEIRIPKSKIGSRLLCLKGPRMPHQYG